VTAGVRRHCHTCHSVTPCLSTWGNDRDSGVTARPRLPTASALTARFRRRPVAPQMQKAGRLRQTLHVCRGWPAFLSVMGGFCPASVRRLR
jgi:hypothetical protein